MKLKFIKDHPNGLKEGQIKEIKLDFAKRLIANGLAEEVKETKQRKPRAKKED